MTAIPLWTDAATPPDSDPVKAGDWLGRFSSTGSLDSVAKVKSVYLDRCPGHEQVLVDLWIYDFQGNRLGRTSPPMGGPRTFEPACSLAGWTRISPPTFPICLKWVKQADGKFVAGNSGPKPLPFGTFKARPSRPKTAALVTPNEPQLDAPALRRAAQELRDVARQHPSVADALVARAVVMETEADDLMKGMADFTAPRQRSR
jgi:hypothetical protein